MRKIPIEETIRDVAEIKEMVLGYVLQRRREDAEKNKAVNAQTEKSTRP